MLEGFANAGRIPELRRRLLFTFGMLAVYRMVVAIPTPGIDGKALAAFFEQMRDSMLGLVRDRLISGSLRLDRLAFNPARRAPNGF